ncbi:MAG: GNAT family N-acetyltransferase [Gammaproteobacteria bacterium]
MTAIKVVRWDQNDLTRNNNEWDDLRCRSPTDGLFLSWDWHATWWEVFAPTLKSELFLLAAYDDTNALVGIAPLHLVNASLGGTLKLKRLQFIGSCWRGMRTVRTEYLDFIARTDVHTEVIQAFSIYLKADSVWDEFVLPHLDKDSATYRSITNTGIWPEAYLRETDAYESYNVDTTGEFSDYLAGLGAKTRGKIYNRRNYLERLGKVELTNADADTLDQYFATLNALHRARWNQDIFADKRLEFHRKLASKLVKKGGVKFSMLSLSGKPLSVLYNLRADQREYGIQTGFDDRFDKKISLGLIHMGYLVEEAFRDRLRVFDFVAGLGKQAHYKKHITQHRRQMVTLQLVRARWLKRAYALYDRLPRWLLQLRRRNEEPAEPASDT